MFDTRFYLPILRRFGDLVSRCVRLSASGEPPGAVSFTWAVQLTLRGGGQLQQVQTEAWPARGQSWDRRENDSRVGM